MDFAQKLFSRKKKAGGSGGSGLGSDLNANATSSSNVGSMNTLVNVCSC